jgi:hypothetical protein
MEVRKPRVVKEVLRLKPSLLKTALFSLHSNIQIGNNKLLRFSMDLNLIRKTRFKVTSLTPLRRRSLDPSKVLL